MRALLKLIAVLLLAAAVFAAAALVYVRRTGLTARGEPGGLEIRIARAIRGTAIPSAARQRRPAVAPSVEAVADGRAHFADHCAICHANDGSGNTAMGRGLWPKAPDLRLRATQDLTDGELFWIIENGIRFTGMPAWGTGTAEGEEASWHLVHFIRHLPQLTREEVAEMESLNPKSPEEIRQQIREEEFLEGGTPQPAAPASPHKHGKQGP
jgi:mono/diheme cytochrome c family protein